MAEGFWLFRTISFPLRSSLVVIEHRSTQGRENSARMILAVPGQGKGGCIWGEYSPNGFKTRVCPRKAIPVEV